MVGLFGDAVVQVNSNKSTAMLIIVIKVKRRDSNQFEVGVSDTLYFVPILSFLVAVG